MDLNEKIAARRRELAIESEKVRKAELAALKAERAKHQIEIISNQHAISEKSKGEVNKPIEEEVDDNEIEVRMTSGEKATGYIFVALFFLCGVTISWWLGTVFLVLGLIDFSRTKKRYKKLIIEERKLEDDALRKEIRQSVTMPDGQSSDKTCAVSGCKNLGDQLFVERYICTNCFKVYQEAVKGKTDHEKQKYVKNLFKASN